MTKEGESACLILEETSDPVWNKRQINGVVTLFLSMPVCSLVSKCPPLVVI